LSRWGNAAVAASVCLSVAGIGLGVTAIDQGWDGGGGTHKTTVDVVAGGKVRLDAPKAGQAKAVAFWFHGQNGTADTRMDESWLNRLRESGWAVVSADLGGNHWGSREATAAVSAVSDWAEEKAGAPVTMFVAGSMGGLASLNAMTHGETPKCWYGTMPVLDQRTVERVPRSSEEIAKVWGASGPPAEHIPVENLGRLPTAARYRVLASPADTWVPKEANADRLAASGLDVSTLTVAGEHGDPSHFNADDLAAFADACD
jgi:hypothetical protein